MACFRANGHWVGASSLSDNTVGGHGALVWRRFFVDVDHIVLLQFAFMVRACDFGNTGFEVRLLGLWKQLVLNRFGLRCTANQ